MEAGTTPPARQPWTNNRNAVVGVVALVAIIAIGLILFFLLHTSKKAHPLAEPIGPLGYKTVAGLTNESRFINTKFYWAGPKPGFRYRFQRTNKNFIYVGYIPRGVPIIKATGVLTIATYFRAGAYKGLSKKKFSTHGPGGSVIWIETHANGTSAYMAWPNKNVEVEVAAPTRGLAKRTATSGNVQPIR